MFFPVKSIKHDDYFSKKMLFTCRGACAGKPGGLPPCIINLTEIHISLAILNSKVVEVSW
jgi:hypothetical protein